MLNQKDMYLFVLCIHNHTFKDMVLSHVNMEDFIVFNCYYLLFLNIGAGIDIFIYMIFVINGKGFSYWLFDILCYKTTDNRY